MTTTVKRSNAIWRIKNWLEGNKDKLVPVDNQPKVLVATLEKLGIESEPTEVLAYLTEEEYQSLYNNVEVLNNKQLESFLNKILNIGYSDYGREKYEVYNDDSNIKFDWD
jgi:precorrin-6B methylase 1